MKLDITELQSKFFLLIDILSNTHIIYQLHSTEIMSLFSDSSKYMMKQHDPEGNPDSIDMVGLNEG